MSTLKADTIQSTGGGAATLTKQSAAKQWCHWNQDGTQTIRDSFGISSLDDDGVGDSSLNYTSAMSDANYVNIMNGAHFIGTAGGSVAYNTDNQTTTGSNVIRCLRIDTQASYDSETTQSVVHGDLA